MGVLKFKIEEGFQGRVGTYCKLYAHRILCNRRYTSKKGQIYVLVSNRKRCRSY